MPMEGLWRMAVPNGPGPPARGTGGPAQTAVGAYGLLVGDGMPQKPGPTIWGDEESCPGVGGCLWGACGGWQFTTARAHKLGRRGVPPMRRSVPMEGLQGTPVSNGPGPRAGGTGTPAKLAVGA